MTTMHVPSLTGGTTTLKMLESNYMRKIKMTTVYLVKSSQELEYGEIYWENLRVFSTLEKAEEHAAKVQALIDKDADADLRNETVEIEEFTLED